MAHELEFVDGKACMAYAGDPPWHKEGTRVLPDLTPEQMLDAAGLNWEVEKAEVYTKLNGIEIPVKRKALIRSSDQKILSVISDDWNPVQNSEAFDFFHQFVMEGDMEMHTAGSLKGGNMVWALARVKDSFTIEGKDKVDSYLLFSNPHEYGHSVDIRFTPIRAVCWNTLSMALNKNADVQINLNHRSKFDPENVKKTLNMAKSKMGDYKAVAELLASKRFDDDNVKKYLQSVFPSLSTTPDQLSRPATKAYGVLESQPGNEYAPGSWWQAFNATTYTIDHILGRTVDSRLTSAWYGVNRQKKLTALKNAVTFAEMA